MRKINEAQLAEILAGLDGRIDLAERHRGGIGTKGMKRGGKC